MKKILGNKKAISTILAALLMVVIVVVASVMVYAWSTGLLGTLLVTPHTGQENLSMENYAFTGTDTVTLSLRNIGSATTSLATYYVKDTSANQYARTTYSAGPAAPNTLLSAPITIATTCGASCTYNSGANSGGFTFTSGSWEITVITGANQQFKFTVTK